MDEVKKKREELFDLRLKMFLEMSRTREDNSEEMKEKLRKTRNELARLKLEEKNAKGRRI